MKKSTQSIHGGVPRRKPDHSLTTPVIQSATFTFENTADLLDFMNAKLWGQGSDQRVEYARYGSSTHRAVEQKIAALEHGEKALLFASGMTALSTLLLADLASGHHLIITDDCYKHTHEFCTVFLKRFGIETTIVPMGDYAGLESAIRPKKTRYIISESPTNPYLRIADFSRLAAIGKKHGVKTLIDSTFGTPINQLPLDYGIDLVLHSATKYLGGHHDLLAGVVVGSQAALNPALYTRGILGGLVAPQTAALLERGLRTLALRVEQHNKNGLAIAQFLEKHAKIRCVWYPGLPSHPDHDLACQQMTGFGGVVSFEVNADLETTGRFIDALRLPYIALSLGGVESLIEQPAIMAYFDKEPEERAALGISDGLIRFAIGIEDTDDLIADLDQALAKI